MLCDNCINNGICKLVDLLKMCKIDPPSCDKMVERISTLKYYNKIAERIPAFKEFNQVSLKDYNDFKDVQNDTNSKEHVNKSVEKCSVCGAPTDDICCGCGKAICEEHSCYNPIDGAAYCENCWSDDDEKEGVNNE